MPITICNKQIGPMSPVFLIAEIAQAHDGSLGIAHSYIDAAADIGVDAIKFQTHIAEFESTKNDVFRVPFSQQDGSRFDYWKRMEFSRPQWAGLLDHAHKKGLVFISSPFSLEALTMLIEIGSPAVKLASGEIFNSILREACCEAQLPVFYSTGMSNWAEIDEVARAMRDSQSPTILMQCTSGYPTPLSQVGLNVIEDMKARYGDMVGLSDHSGTIHPSLAAMALGVVTLEFHLTFHREMFGPDTSSSLTLEEVELIRRHRDALYTLRSNPVDKDQLYEKLKETRALFSRSICLRSALKKGQKISADNILLKKPGTGIPPKDISEIIGRKVNRSIEADELLSWDDLADD